MFAMSVFWAFQICPFNALVIAFGDFAFEFIIIAVKENVISDNPVFLLRGDPAFGKFGTIICVIIIFAERAIEQEIPVANLSGAGTGIIQGQEYKKYRKHDAMPPGRSKSWMPDKDGLLLFFRAVAGAVLHHVYPLHV
jgi:hypothetical protein